ncbi:hypothetical protein HK097_005256 [Rhizophlyctis rosea]|uniref:Uncharacterized protein n=1 Tax=Rhizophlyctis rosea TaxID=64517 RepID=A0AAD5SDL2_9FUNG|nr:hypothetical protein HK097_005256 [Rhizophlyctis rosea]
MVDTRTSSSYSPLHQTPSLDPFMGESTVPLDTFPSSSSHTAKDPFTYTSYPAPVTRRRRILSLFLLSNFITLVFTVFPVLVDLPNVRRDGWYVGNDIIRLLEPIVVFPLQFAILYESGIFWSVPKGRHRGMFGVNFDLSVRVALQPLSKILNAFDTPEPLIIATLFMVASAIYQQGAGFHSASVMYKHTVEVLVDRHPEITTTYPEINAIYSYIRNLWQHIIAHYMYAIGGILQSFIFAYVYRDVSHPSFDNAKDRTLWILATILYGLTVGAVAINFPYGSAVALVLILVWGFGFVGGYLWRIGGGRVWGKRFVLQYYLASYCIGLVIVIGWIIHAKGFKNREETGLDVKD